MTDISKITNEELQKKMDEMPSTVRSVITSEELDNKLDELDKKYDLIEELNEPEIIQQLILLLASGLIRKDEFSGQIKTYTYRNEQESKEIADEILKILGPALPIPTFGNFQIKTAPTAETPVDRQVKTESKANAPPLKPFNVESVVRPTNPIIPPKPTATTPAPAAAPQTNTPLKTQIPPGFGQLRIPPLKPANEAPKATPAVAPTPSAAPAPFIIHEHKDAEAVATKSDTFGGLRPTFIKPTFTQPSSAITPPTPPAAAKVDFGKGIYNFKASFPQQPAQTDVPVKRVDYSAPAQTTPLPPKAEISQDSTQLKDLPIKGD